MANFYAVDAASSGSSSGIKSINADTTQAQVIAAGTGISVTTSAGTTTVTNTSPSSGGTVTSVSVTTANGVSGTVATATTTPAISLALGAITPSSVNASGTVLGSNLSGTNTGDVTIGTANGLSLTGQALSLQTSSTSTTGALTNTDWNTFNGKQASGSYITSLTGDVTGSGPGATATTLATVNANVGSFTLSNITVNGKGLITAASTTATGNLTDTGTDGITITGGSGAVIGSGTSIAQHVADSTHNGYLSSTDWTTFNNKQSTITTGNLTDAGTDGITVTGGTGAVIGSGTSIAQHVADTTHNGYLSSTDWNTFNGKQASGNYITALTGDVTASGPGSSAASLVATSNATLTTLSGLTTASSLASIGTVTSGTWSATTIALNKGGTGQTTKTAAFDALSPMSASGDVIYGGASGTGTRLAKGSDGQVLTLASGLPSWANGLSNPMTTLGDIIYENATPAPARLAGNTTSTKNFLTQTGTGSVSAAPTWGTIASSDLPVWTTSNAGSVVQPNSYVKSDTGTGHGSTATRVRRFLNNTTVGSGITCSGNDTTNGTTYTINQAGIYGITYTDSSSNNSNCGIALNAGGTTDIDALAAANRLGMNFVANTGARVNCAATIQLAVNDVITAQDDSNVNGSTNTTQFIITQIVRF